MLIALLYLRLRAEVHSDSTSQDRFAIKHLSDCDCILGREECAYDSSKRLQRAESMDRCVFVDSLVDALEVCGREDFGSLEISDEESVAWW